MTFEETMQTLKSKGTAQNVKIYKRHGAGDTLFGVSFAELTKLRKKIKVAHDLSVELWATGNTDAQTLALMVADPEQLKPGVADAWLREISYDLLAGYLAQLVARSPIAESRLNKWTGQKKEYVRSCGFALLSELLRVAPEVVSEDRCREFLKQIESEIHGSANRARNSMNGALCSIGIFVPELRAEAIAAAERIGTVDVDHGETSCTTPDAAAYIRKAATKKKPSRRRRC